MELIRVHRETPPGTAAGERVPTHAGPAWLRRLREDATRRFAHLGIPTPRHEEWRATDITRIAQIGFRPAAGGAVDETRLARLSLSGVPGTRLVFIDGRFALPLSRLPGNPGGARVGSLAAVLREEPDLLEQWFRAEDDPDQALSALNLAMAEDGAFVHVPAGTLVDEPIHLVFAHTGDDATMVHPRNLVVLGADSRATILETYVGLGTGQYLTNSVTDLHLGPGASVEHCKLQREGGRAYHIGRLRVRQEASSRLLSHSFADGAAVGRSDLDVLFAGEEASCTLNGLYLCGGRQLIDNHTRIDHAVPHCTSRELYKGVLDGKSRGVFNGKVIVRLDAQKTDSTQANPNLLLSEDAVINTRPQLEIFADDVKCTHGAAIGRLDGEALFYLRSRGIAFPQARAMLIRAFADELVERVGPEPLRAGLSEMIDARLAPGHVKEVA